jgi:magnesium-protoporphyrin IX monomethyl ester (oxidative) cyclase
MRILLIYPPVSIYGSGSVGPHPPLGLAYIASYLRERKKTIEIQILDTLTLGKDKVFKQGSFRRIGLTDKDIRQHIKKFQPDLVGISVMYTAFANDGFRMAELVKKINKNTPVVMGGSHVSINPKEILNNHNVDYAVYGEGEITLLNLIDSLEKKISPKKITGIALRIGKKIIINPPTPFIKDLNQIPFPARDLLPMNLYDTPSPFQMRHPAAQMVTSRGCPNNCVYCSIHSVWGHRWRSRNPENVIAEIEHLVNQYGIKEISFQDDSLSVDSHRLEKICDEIIKKKINIKWTTPNGIAHWTLTKKLLKKMKKAGCYRITFGIESGNETMRRWIGKPYKLSQAKELINYANKIGMWTLITNIIGFPYESKKDIDDTIKFAINSSVDFAFFFRLGPRPGTPVYEEFKKNNWLPENKNILFSELVSCETKYFKEGELFSIQQEAYSRFIKGRILRFDNLIHIIRKINSIEDLFYLLGLISASLKMIANLLKTRGGVTSKSLRL